MMLARRASTTALLLSSSRSSACGCRGGQRVSNSLIPWGSRAGRISAAPPSGFLSGPAPYRHIRTRGGGEGQQPHNYTQRRPATTAASDGGQQQGQSLPLKSVRAWRRAHEHQVKKIRRVGFAFPRLRSAETAVPLLVTEAEDSIVSPSWETLRLVALQRAVPFVGFGFMDNAIMILAGDYIETSIGFTLGISTMAAAALGVLVADVLGLGVGGLIEELAVKMGVPEPRLTKSQAVMWITRLTAMGGSSLGMAVGCLLGMLPLAFIDLKKGDREESPSDVYSVMAREAQDMLHAERVVIMTVEHGTRHMGQHYASDNADKALPPLFLRDVVLRTLQKDEGVMYTYEHDEPAPGGIYSALSWPVFDREGKIIAVVVAINKRGIATPANNATTSGPPAPQQHHQQQQQRGALESFDRLDVQSMVSLCSKAGEAMENLYRRAEEHNSFVQNMDGLQMHMSVPLRLVHASHGTSEHHHHHHSNQEQPRATPTSFTAYTPSHSVLRLKMGR